MPDSGSNSEAAAAEVLVIRDRRDAAASLGPVARHENLVTVARLRGNRVLYRLPSQAETGSQPGHPTWYAERFGLQDSSTWGELDEVAQTTYITRRGRTYTVHLKGWHDLLMSGTRDCPMHRYPFTLIRIWLTDEQGNRVLERDLWLVAFGKRQWELSLVEAWEAYGQRYDVERFFRFGKQRLLLAAYQTNDVRRGENWWQIAALAYVQMWLARLLVEAMPRAWERYLPPPTLAQHPRQPCNAPEANYSGDWDTGQSAQTPG